MRRFLLSASAALAVATTARAQDAGFTSLFDGSSTASWRGYRSTTLPAGWRVVDGALTRVASGGDIVTVNQYEDFELRLEWKVAEGGNSGIFYRVTEEFGAPYESGPEMQVLDDARHADGRSRLTSAGAVFGLYPFPAGAVKPAGEWNEVRLVVKGPHVEHWLNGTKIEYELWTADWKALVAGSKFKQWPGYGLTRKGHISLQDHGDLVSYRNIRIRELN